MTEWTDGYRAALADIERLADPRFAKFPARFRKAVAQLALDLRSDADDIARGAVKREQLQKLAAESAARQPKQPRLDLCLAEEP